MFNDPDRLISSTKRVGKNVVMTAHENGKESSESVINVVPKKVYEAKTGAPVIDLGGEHVLVKVNEFVSREDLVGLDLDVSNLIGMPDTHITIKESNIHDMASLIKPVYPGEHFYAVLNMTLFDVDSAIDISAGLDVVIPEPGLYVSQSAILSTPEKIDIKEGYEKFFLPTVTKADDEKHLVVKDGIWTPTKEEKEEEETGPKFSVQGYTYDQLHNMFLANIPHPETEEESSEIKNNVFKYMPIPLMTQIEANHKKVGRVIFDLVDCQIPILGVGDRGNHVDIELTFLMRDAIIGVPFRDIEQNVSWWGDSSVKIYLEQFLTDFDDINSFAMGRDSTILTHYCPPGSGSDVYPPSRYHDKHLGFFVPSVSELLGADAGVSSIEYDLEGQQFIGLKKIGVHQKSENLTGYAHNYLFKPDHFINNDGEVVEHQGPVCLMTRTWDKTDTEGKHILGLRDEYYDHGYIADVTSLGIGDTSVTIDNDVVDVCIRPAFKVRIRNYTPVS